jgi:hypothetical protein
MSLHNMKRFDIKAEKHKGQKSVKARGFPTFTQSGATVDIPRICPRFPSYSQDQIPRWRSE